MIYNLYKGMKFIIIKTIEVEGEDIKSPEDAVVNSNKGTTISLNVTRPQRPATLGPSMQPKLGPSFRQSSK